MLVLLLGCESVALETENFIGDETTSEYEKTFVSEELGIKFSYNGSDEAKTETELNGIDTGKRRDISTQDFKVSLTSSDYIQGVGEGCCFSFAGPSVDLTISDEELTELLSHNFGEIYNLKRIKIDGRDAVSFVNVNEYIKSWFSYKILMPHNKSPYTNILIVGASSKMFEHEEDPQNYLLDEEFKNKIDELNNYLSTFEFLQ